MKTGVVIAIVGGILVALYFAFSKGLIGVPAGQIRTASGALVPNPTTNYSGYLQASTAPGVAAALNGALSGLGSGLASWFSPTKGAIAGPNQGANPNSPSGSQPSGPSGLTYQIGSTDTSGDTSDYANLSPTAQAAFLNASAAGRAAILADSANYNPTFQDALSSGNLSAFGSPTTGDSLVGPQVNPIVAYTATSGAAFDYNGLATDNSFDPNASLETVV